MDELTLEALTRLELRETELLAWGAVGAEWTEDEILGIFAELGAGPDVLARLLDTFLIVRTPNGGYRSRAAETVRLLATLRQSFRNGRVTDGRPLVLDYRFLHRPRRKPERNIPSQTVLDEVRHHLGDSGYTAARAIAPAFLSGFQSRSTKAVLSALGTGKSSGVMVTAGTGSGKTLAFYLPLLSWLADQVAVRRPTGTLALALYPRNELLKDQLRALLEYVDRMAKAGPKTRNISIATWFGQTPTSARQMQKSWPRRGQDWVCPFLKCIECDGELLWRKADAEAKPARERLECGSATCDASIEGDRLRLTRDSALRNPATVMLTTTESLNRQLAAPGNLVAFGVRPATAVAILLDEVHTYEGAAGAQNALLLRRLVHAMRRSPVWVGLSATLLNANEFFSRLVGLTPTDTTVVQPEMEELVDSGAEYLLALRHNPHSRTGPLSATIQTGMALTRCMDNLTEDPFDPPPSSGGVVGKRVFVFTDKLDSTNRLYWDLSDAEGTNKTGQSWRRPRTLAHLRAREQMESNADHREPAVDRDADGQWWWLPEQLGYALEADRSLRVGRTSSQDRGVESEAQVVVATATLEVGFDDDRVGAVIQHKAPHDAAQFLQRKGRAGRNPITRPWTVVVLSEWGRDRQAWDAYDALFDPELPPRNLPLDNLYVLRIQAVYALLDWLAVELRYTDNNSTWVDLAGPAELLFPNNATNQQRARARQTALAAKLARLLMPGPERNRLRKHLREALALGTGELAESVVDTLLWESPRPLLLAVVPTMRRRLEDQWLAERPPEGDTGLQTRTPLRDFVPGNLFDDLLVPDVDLLVPGRGSRVEVQQLPALRALREFCPGNVSRHFGVYVENKRHWLSVPTAVPGEPELRVDVSDAFAARFLDTIDVGPDRVTVHRPLAITLQPVPDDVKDSSSVAPDWEFHVTPLGSGSPCSPGRGASSLLADLTAHLHIQGGGVRTIRFARTASGTMWDQPNPRPVKLAFGTGAQDDWIPSAIGVDMHCDAMMGTVRIPPDPGSPTPAERTSRLRYLLTAEADLPEAMSVFDRDHLVQIVTLAVAASPGALPYHTSDKWEVRLLSAASVLGVLDGHAEGADAISWRQWLADAQVVRVVHDAVLEVFQQQRSAAWQLWWQRGYTLSVAQLVVNGLAARCPGVDTDELAVDLDPEHVDRFWLSERSPGGTGQVETFRRVLAQDPEAFSRALEDALRPTALDTVDEELSALVRADAPAVGEALARLRTAWRHGHAAVADAISAVEVATRAVSINLGGPARSALSARLAGPGTHRDLISKVVSWLDLRDRITREKQLVVDPRTLGALVADDRDIDEVLHLGDNTSPERRARAVTNVLWPWGRAPQPPSASYGNLPEPSFDRVRHQTTLAPEAMDIVVWDNKTRDSVHQTLLRSGEVVLRVGHGAADVLRSALIDLQTSAVEVGSLLAHPIAVGLARSARTVELRLLLREAP